VLNLCANNYLGLADHPAMIAAAQQALDRWGSGWRRSASSAGRRRSTRSSRAGSPTSWAPRRDLYGSCFDANGGLFETLLGPEDAVISDALNHASIIDGVRLCKARRFRYVNRDMADLELRLQEAQDARHRLIATDGVFSMDGYVAPWTRSSIWPNVTTRW
jgi:glycine C-acetyltransferase